MPVEPIMRPGQPPAKISRDWSLLVPLVALAVAVTLALLGIWLVL